MIRIHGASSPRTKLHGCNDKPQAYGNNVQVYQCPICREKFEKAEFLEKHKENQTSMQCVECNLTFCNSRTFFVHKYEVHKVLEDEYFVVCKDCSRIVTKTAYPSHRSRMHREIKPEHEGHFECGVCGKKITNKMLFTKHMRVQHGERKFSCSSCDKKYITENHLIHHIKAQHKDVRFSCTICGMILYTQSRLARHSMKHLDEDMESTVCTYCNKVFENKTEVKEHFYEAHINQKSWNCHLCDMKFVMKRQLGAHVRDNHSIETALTCEVCGQTLKNRKGALEEHMKIHLDIKDYECDVCQKRFRLKNKLTIHKQIHSDERNYVCSECGKSFKKYQNLFLHKRIHTGIKPYKCTMCDMRFFQPYMLKTHMVYHTGERNYHCRPCNLSYIGMDSLKKHNKRHHNSNKAEISYNTQNSENAEKFSEENEEQN